MRYVLYLSLTCFLMVMFTQPFAADAADQNAPALEALAANAVNAFAVDVYRQLAEEGGNLFFSPYSISTALAMTYAGASGDTATEMAKALHFSDHEPEIHAAMKSLQDRFNSIPTERGSLDVANRLWLDKGEALVKEYESITMGNYGAGVETADFLYAYDEERLRINDWVAQKTRDKIRDLLQDGNVTPDTKLVLVNAIYFNSAWQEPFDKALTREEPFRTGKGEQHDVSMMRRTDHFLYGENPYAQWVKIPYSIPGFSMMVLLPRENGAFTPLEDLEKLEKKLTHEALASLMSDMNFSRVALRMPKFKDERRYSLAEILNKLGMNLAFTEDADFSGMVVEPRKNGYAIHVDFVVHKAFIEIDEEKTEAAASTAVGMVRATGAMTPEPVIEFNADHPFIYCLTDDQTGAILFMGRMEQP